MGSSTNLKGRVAVVTGAASGIGLALAIEAAARGMDVALADIGEDALAVAKAQVEAQGVRAIALKTDVRALAEVEALRDAATDQLGPVWLVCNNAGIARMATAWNTSEEDWRRVLDINLGGVVNGLLAFLPGLMARETGHILNTASAGGLIAMPASAAYVASKHAVVGLSETLYRDLTAAGTGVGVSALCPALVKTAIMGTREIGGKQVSAIDSSHAMEPAEVARIAFDAIEARQFWILTHGEALAPQMRTRLEQMLTQTNPDRHSIDPGIAEQASAATGVDYISAD